MAAASKGFHSEEIMKNIYKSFIEAKKAFSPAVRDKYNPFFKSKYVDLASCIDVVEDALLKNGMAFYQETFLDESGVTVETVFIHESGEVMKCGKLHVPASKEDPQGYGSALTYARRYSLMAACGIAPEDDDGNAASLKPTAAPKKRGAIQDTIDCMAPLNEEEKLEIMEIAFTVREEFEAYGPQAAHEKLLEYGLDNRKKINLWGVLPSDIKNPITKYSRSLNEPKGIANEKV